VYPVSLQGSAAGGAGGRGLDFAGLHTQQLRQCSKAEGSRCPGGCPSAATAAAAATARGGPGSRCARRSLERHCGCCGCSIAASAQSTGAATATGVVGRSRRVQQRWRARGKGQQRRQPCVQSTPRLLQMWARMGSAADGSFEVAGCVCGPSCRSHLQLPPACAAFLAKVGACLCGAQPATLSTASTATTRLRRGGGMHLLLAAPCALQCSSCGGRWGSRHARQGVARGVHEVQLSCPPT
jgi:hypothetical protein